MVKHTQTVRRLLPTYYLCMFDHFVGLALKGIVSKGSGSQKSQTISPKSLVSSKQRSNIHSYESNLALLFLDLN